MLSEKLIAIDIFCSHHNIEVSFIQSLQQRGLLEIKTIKKVKFMDFDQLPQAEKYIRFFYDLDINLEGIETITHLLLRINALQNEVIELKNRLILFEEE